MQASVDALDRSPERRGPARDGRGASSTSSRPAASSLILIGENPALAAAMRSFDRKQAQKIRKPKSKDEEAEEIADRLEELAQDEDFVYATIAAGTGRPAAPRGQGGQTGETAEPKDAERRPSPRTPRRRTPKAKDAEAKDEPEAKEKSQGRAQGRRRQGKEGPEGPGVRKGKAKEAEGQGDEGEGGRASRRSSTAGPSPRSRSRSPTRSATWRRS